MTHEGLQEQLLSNLVHQERPDLEEQRCVLLESLVNDKMKLRDVEDRTLNLHSTSIGNVLDDEDLINTGNHSPCVVCPYAELLHHGTTKVTIKLNSGQSKMSCISLAI